MWILPKQLHTSPFVPDMAALISDSTEQSEICAQSLLARSKPSPARTWSQRWKRDSWTRHLSGRILKPSHGPSFVTAWTSSVAATRASHSQQPARDSAPKTSDTSGRLSQPELLQCDQVSVFLKTSRDISALGYPTCCKTWSDWVTERRSAWRARVNAARLTRGKEFGSWPTIRASEYKDVGPVGSKSHDHMLGKHYLCAVVTQEETNGQAAPASSSSLGSRQGSSDRWPTPNAMDSVGSRRHGYMDDGRPRSATRPRKDKLTGHPGTTLTDAVWATPATRDTQGQRGAAANARKGNPLDTLPNQMAQWGTLTARDHKSGRGNEEREYKELTPMVERQQSGKLNPRWVETLMGLPIGWTMPSCTSPVTIEQMSCGVSGTELFRQPASERGDFLLAS